MNKIIGIISYLPNETEARKLRYERVVRLFNQIQEFWPDIPILLIKQNWKMTKIPVVKNTLIKKNYPEPLGILGARQELERQFLALEEQFDYLILFDDDAIIEETEPSGAKKYIEEIDKHPDGFCFLQYASAQLSGCAISRFIIKKEPMVSVSAENNEAYEDTLYSNLLHYKYSEREFINGGINCTQFQKKDEIAPSTWSENKTGKDYQVLTKNTYQIVDYIKRHKELPKNIKQIIQNNKPKAKKKHTYLDLDYLGL